MALLLSYWAAGRKGGEGFLHDIKPQIQIQSMGGRFLFSPCFYLLLLVFVRSFVI